MQVMTISIEHKKEKYITEKQTLLDSELTTNVETKIQTEKQDNTELKQTFSKNRECILTKEK